MIDVDADYKVVTIRVSCVQGWERNSGRGINMVLTIWEERQPLEQARSKLIPWNTE